MQLSFTTTFDASNIHKWSGTPYHMAKAIQNNAINTDFIGSLTRRLPPGFKLKKILKKYLMAQQESPSFNVFAAKHYSEQVARRLSINTDIVLSPLVNPIAYLDCKQPIVLWTDSVYAALVGFYPRFNRHSPSSIQQGNLITEACLSRSRLAIFSSDWAANSAIDLYGADRSKVKVIPYGANISAAPSSEEVNAFISLRKKNIIKLLFLAKDWQRKGGETVIEVTKALHEAGHAVELSIVGITPNIKHLPTYIKCHGFISKQSHEGRESLKKLLREAHFLFVPSRAEAYGCVFAEANAYGVPCLTTHVGGISTIVKDDINGKAFSLNASVNDYCNYIIHTVSQETLYKNLALSSYNEFISRLNWDMAAKQLKLALEEII